MTRGKTPGPDSTTSSLLLQMCLHICSPTIPANYDRHNIIISIIINTQSSYTHHICLRIDKFKKLFLLFIVCGSSSLSSQFILLFKRQFVFSSPFRKMFDLTLSDSSSFFCSFSYPFLDSSSVVTLRKPSIFMSGITLLVVKEFEMDNFRKERCLSQDRRKSLGERT